MNMAGVLVFLATYVLVSMRRIGRLGLDRPAAALLGAVACVGLGALSPEAALASIDGATLLLLLGVMGMGAFLTVDGFFPALETRLAGLAASPGRLLGAVLWGGGALSALITNDAVCVLGTPLVVRLITRHRLPPVPFLLALATGANTGSVATLVGNPQNMLCGSLGQLSYLDHLLLMGPVTLAALALNHLVLAWSFRRELTSSPPTTPEAQSPPMTRQHAITLGVIGATAVACTLGAPLAWAAAGGFVALMLLHRRDTRLLWQHIDWSLLLFFAGLFVVVEGLRQSGATAWLFGHLPLAAVAQGPGGLGALSGLFLIGSNIVSNVPFILVIKDQMATLGDPRLGWELLAMASTFAGNLTLLGSAANVIVAEASHEVGSFGFWQHLKIGLPVALGTTALGTAWLVLMA